MKKKACARFETGKCVSKVNPQLLESFYKHESMKDGHLTVCKQCLVSDARAKRLVRNGGVRKIPKRPKAMAVSEKCCSKFKRGGCASHVNPQPISNFRAQAGRVNGRSVCGTCEQKYASENREAAVLRSRAWNKDNKIRNKFGKVKRNYGITQQDFSDILVKQNWQCAICKADGSAIRQGLVVDHCHKSGKVRGLLCHRCNRGLGFFKDNPDSLRSAISYLKKASAWPLATPV